jgi:dTDP-4-dehydrorhamnose reductase
MRSAALALAVALAAPAAPPPAAPGTGGPASGAGTPADGRLDTTRLRETFGVALPTWEAGLARILKALRA